MTENSNTPEWSINRIDYLHQNLLDELNSEQEKFESDSDLFLDPIKRSRNYVIVAVLITILGLIGSRLSFLIGDSETLIASIGSIIGGGIVYLIISKIYDYYSKPLDAVINSYIHGKSMFNHSQTYFSTLTINLNKIEQTDLDKYANFTINLILATKISLLNSFKKAQKKKLSRKMRDYLDEKKNNLQSELEGAVNVPNLLDEKNLPKELVEFTNRTFSELRKQ